MPLPAAPCGKRTAVPIVAQRGNRDHGLTGRTSSTPFGVVQLGPARRRASEVARRASVVVRYPIWGMTEPAVRGIGDDERKQHLCWGGTNTNVRFPRVRRHHAVTTLTLLQETSMHDVQQQLTDHRHDSVATRPSVREEWQLDAKVLLRAVVATAMQRVSRDRSAIAESDDVARQQATVVALQSAHSTVTGPRARK